MKLIIIFFIFFLLYSTCYGATISATIKDVTTELPEEEQIPRVETKIYADIYINNNLIASDIIIVDKSKAKEECMQFLNDYRKDHTLSTSDINKITIKTQ